MNQTMTLTTTDGIRIALQAAPRSGPLTDAEREMYPRLTQAFRRASQRTPVTRMVCGRAVYAAITHVQDDLVTVYLKEDQEHARHFLTATLHEDVNLPDDLVLYYDSAGRRVDAGGV